MLVTIKDVAKLVGITIIVCCAVLVCTMFLNYNIDIGGISNQLTSQETVVFYEAQVSMSKLVCIVSGCCLLITSVVMLAFYIKNYIDTHKKQLGILKALGYSNLKISKSFWVFGVSTFIGAVIGFAGSFLIMPTFYRIQNEDGILPDFSVCFHGSLFVYMVLVPTVVFALFAIGYGCYKLKRPVLMLLKKNIQNTMKVKKPKKVKDYPFLVDLKRSTIRSKKTLSFFIIFSSFCFSSMTQMAFSMDELASPLMGDMVLMIGLVLAGTTLFLAITTVVKGNTQTIAMMRTFGYSQKECTKAVLLGYRPLAYIGFVIGSGYQYAILRFAMDFIFKDVQNVPIYEFDFPMMFVSLGVFILVYEITMYVYSRRINKISIKEIMVES